MKDNNMYNIMGGKKWGRCFGPGRFKKTPAALLAGLFFVVFGGALFFTPVYAQTSSPANISTVQDTSSDAARNFSITTAQATSDRTVYGNARTGSAGTDPAGGTYTQLVPGSANQFGYAVLAKQVSAQSNFTVNGYFYPDRLTTNGSSNSGDWIGLVLLPVDIQNVTQSSKGGGGGLGLYGVSNALALGIDMYRNANYNDPSDGPFAALRWTDASGNIQPVGPNNSYRNLYTSSQNLTQWNTQIQYTFSYFYNGGQAYVIGTLQDNHGHTWNFDTRNPGGGAAALPITPPQQGYFTVALDAANGSNYQAMRGSFDSLSGTLASSTATIHYRVDPSIVPAGGTVAPSTTLRSTVGDIVGVTGISAGAKAGTDTYTYDGNVPASASAPYKTGWHIARTLSTATGREDVTFNVDPAKNEYILYYAPDYQAATLVTDSTDPNGAQTVESINGGSGGTMSWTKKDADLARSGYVYTVRAPDGKDYGTLSAAQAAVSTYDNTANGTNRSDTAIQTFTVSYRVDKSAAEAAIRNANSSNVANDPAVVAAKNALQGIIDDPNSTPQQVQNAIDALNNAVATAKTARDNAIKSANDTIANTGSLSVKNDAPVVAAEDNLKKVIADPNATAQDITNAIDALNKAVADANAARIQALSDATNAMNATSPVSNEPGIQDKVTSLRNIIAQPGAKTQDIQAATSALNQALTDAKAARDNANTAANATVEAARGSGMANEPAVLEAINKLLQTQQLAASDDANNLTQNIIDATKAVNEAANAAKEEHDKARADADTAIANITQVGNEPDVKAAIEHLNDPTLSTQQIRDAITALNGVVGTAQSARSAAKSMGQEALDKAAVELANSEDPELRAAADNLKTIMDKANANAPDGLTSNIIDATGAVNNELTTLDITRATAQLDAARLLTQTKPVSNEQAVKDTIDNLKTVMANPGSSAQNINDAITQLNTALTNENARRDTANTAANDAITAADAVKNEPAVQKAIQNLRDTMERAALDSTADLTQTIYDRIAELNTAVNDVKQQRENAVTAANNAISAGNTKPVSNEPAVLTMIQQINDTINNTSQASTIEQLNALVTALNNTLASTKDARNQAVTDANQWITSIENDPMANEPEVISAINTLKDTITRAAADDPTALTVNIQADTDKLRNARNEAPANRNAAIDTANQAIDNATTSPAADDPSVTAAKNELTALLNNTSTTTTQAIKDATDKLDKAVRDAVVKKATDAIDNAETSIVKNEPSVIDAINHLKAMRDDPSSTLRQIADATTALENAVKDARTARLTAEDNANSTLEALERSRVRDDPAVTDAARELDELLKNSPNATTQEITDAVKKLNDAVTEAAKTLLANLVQPAIDRAQASPVANEREVANRITDLENMRSSTDSSIDDIINAVNTLNDTVARTRVARDTAISDANNELEEAKLSPVKNEVPMIDAMDHLQDVLDGFDPVPPNSTTQQTLEATTALDTIKEDETATRNTAVDGANQAIENANTFPAIVDEPPVASAVSTVRNVLDSPDSTTMDIIHASNVLDNVIKDQVSDIAQRTIVDVDLSMVSNEPDVIGAKNHLQQILHDQNSSIQDISNATGTLSSTVATATTNRNYAVTSALMMIDTAKQSAASGHPAVIAAIEQLQKLLDAPGTTQQIIDATTHLKNEFYRVLGIPLPSPSLVPSPRTGDDSNLAMGIALVFALSVGIALCGAAAFRVHRRKQLDMRVQKTCYKAGQREPARK